MKWIKKENVKKPDSDIGKKLEKFFEESSIEYNSNVLDDGTLVYTCPMGLICYEDDILSLYLYTVCQPDKASIFSIKLHNVFPDVVISDMIYVSDSGSLIQGFPAYIAMRRKEQLQSIDNFLLRSFLSSNINTDEIIN